MGGFDNGQLNSITKISQQTLTAIKEQTKPQKHSVLKIIGLGIWTLFVACVPSYYSYKLGEAKQLTIPITVVDKNGNKLHLEEPIAHRGYYEYPIIIYDKMNNYRRIDKYAFGKELGIKFQGE